MKKILLVLFACSTVIMAAAQANFDMKKIPTTKDGEQFSYFFKTSPDEFRSVYIIPDNNPFSTGNKGVYIRNFDSEITKSDLVNLPDAAPGYLAVYSFGDYNVLAGSMDESPLSFAKDNKLVITDDAGKVLVEQTYKLHGKKHTFTGMPAIRISEDKKYMLVVNIEVRPPEKPRLYDDPATIFVDVYDSKLKKVREDSVQREDVFGSITFLNDVDYAYVNGTVVMIASQPTAITKKTKGTIFAAASDKPGSWKLILSEEYSKGTFNYTWCISNKGMLCISGMQSQGGFVGSGKSSIFFISKDLTSGGSATVKSYSIDKTFSEKFPDVDKKSIKFITSPSKLVKLDDGALYVCEYRLSVSSSQSSATSYFMQTMGLIKFDFDGEIQWANVIKKDVCSKKYVSELFCKAFGDGTSTHLFYYDNPANVVSAKMVRVKVVNPDKLCLVHAVVDADGKITKKIIYKVGSQLALVDLSQTKRIEDGNSFIFVGTGLKIGNKVPYFGILNLE
ncbi:MAG: hypothetical protein WCM76_04455 [Bacteroidota bacterium]